MKLNKQVVKWDITLDDSISAIGLIVGEEEPAIEVRARFSKKEAIRTNTRATSESFYLSYLAEEQSKGYTFQVDDAVFEDLRKEQIVVGPALIPNKLIMRVDENNEPFYGYFTEEAVRNAAYSFQKNKLIDRFNINHDQNTFVDSVFVAESWIVTDTNEDKSRLYGYNLPVGSWFIALKILDTELYNMYVASGELNGFSIETELIERVVFNKEMTDAGKAGNHPTLLRRQQNKVTKS